MASWKPEKKFVSIQSEWSFILNIKKCRAMQIDKYPWFYKTEIMR